MGIEDGSGTVGGPTLDDALWGEVRVESLGNCALGYGVTWAGCYGGIVSRRFNCSASIMSALQTGSPACNEGDVVEGGCVRILVMSSAACRKKSYSLT